MTTDPMSAQRLDEISALAEQYREKRVASQNALIDHDRDEVLRQEGYANCLALIFTEEYGPQLLAEVRRARAAEAELRAALDEAVHEIEDQADALDDHPQYEDAVEDSRAVAKRLRAQLAAKEA